MHNKLKSPECVMTVFGTFDGYPVSFADNPTGCSIFVDLSTMMETECRGPMIVGFRNSLTGGKQTEVQKLYHEAMKMLANEESHARNLAKSMSARMFLDSVAIEEWLWDYPILVRKIGKARSVVARSRKYSGYYRIFGDKMGVITARYLSLSPEWYAKWDERTSARMDAVASGDLGVSQPSYRDEPVSFAMNVEPVQNDQEPDPDNYW